MNTQQKSLPILIRIVPLVALAPEKSPFFSYQSSEDIPRGSVVSISFGPRTLRGIVWEKETASTSHLLSRKLFRYKQVGKILAQAFLSEKTLLFAERLAHDNSLALGTVLLKFLPKTFSKETEHFPKTPKEKQQRRKKTVAQTASFSLTREQKQAARDIRTRPYTLLFGPPASGKTHVYFECIKKLLTKGEQACILVPDQSILIQEESRYARIFGNKSVAIFHTGMKPLERDDLIRRVHNGTISIILGTRSALFLPFYKLNLLIVDDTGASAYRKHGIASPDDAHRSAETLALIHSAVCLFGSSSPSFEMLSAARESNTLVTLPALSDRSLSFHTINLRLERWKKKLSPVSEELGNAIAATVARKEQVLLFVSREGMNSFSVCAECKTVFRCPTCEKPLVYRAEGDYSCVRCKKNCGATPSCPTCGSLAFQHLGAGTERVERDLARRFPHIRTVRYDRKNAAKKSTLSRLREFMSGDRDILITTERGIYGWDLPRLSLVGIIDADTLLGASSWNADETAFRKMLSASGRSGRTGPEKPIVGSVFVQTFHPENPIFSFLATENLEGFFQTLEDERQLLLYPPFGTLTTITCRLANKKKLAQEVDRVHAALRLEAERSKRTLRVSLASPIRQVSPSSKSRFFEQSILIRQSVSAKKNLIDIRQFLATLPREWTQING